MSVSQPTVVMMGECMVELRRDAAGTIKQSFAGDVYNACVYMKRVFPQHQVCIATQVGGDTLSNEMIDTFQSEDINTELVLQDDTRLPGMYWVETDENGERSFLYWRQNAAARYQTTQFSASQINQMKQAEFFFFSGISLAIVIAEHRDAFWALLAELKQSGVKIVFDPNYRERLWSDKDDTKAQYDLAFKASDIVLPGVEDFDFLYQIDSFDGVAEFFEDYQVEELVIKDGPNGVVVIND
jgi:2-dehydro-3-deoxygluconokinase